MIGDISRSTRSGICFLGGGFNPVMRIPKIFELPTPSYSLPIASFTETPAEFYFNSPKVQQNCQVEVPGQKLADGIMSTYRN